MSIAISGYQIYAGAVKASKQILSIKKVADLGKPGAPGHAVELEVTVSRRQVFRAIVPFLVATLGLAAQNDDDTGFDYELLDSSEGGRGDLGNARSRFPKSG